ERERERECRVLVRAGPELERTAADVEADEVAGAPAEPAADGEERQPGLVLAGQHAELDTGLVGDPLQHLGAIAGIANRGRRERQQLVAVELLGLLARGQRGPDERVRAAPAEV